MAISVVQTASTAIGDSGSSVTLNGVVAGNAIVVFTFESSGCSGSVNGSYGAAKDTLTDGFGFNYLSYVFQNSGSGNEVVTCTGSRALFAAEIGGVDAAPYATRAAQVQTNPGTGTDAVTSGAFSPASSSTGLVIACAIDSETLNNAPAVGTGFTDRGTSWNFLGAPLARFESRSLAAASAALFTCTATGVGEQSILALYLLEGGGVVVVPATMPPTNTMFFAGSM